MDSRNVTEARRIALALKREPILAAQAKARHIANGGDKKSDTAKSAMVKGSPPISEDESPAKTKESHTTRNAIAKAANSTGTNVQRVKDVPDPVGHVVSLNEKRRQLTTSQRAMVAAKIANLQRGGDRKSEDFKPSNGGLKSPITINDAAEIMGVSPKSVERGKTIYAKGTPELAESVESGKVTVNRAAEIATLPKPEQSAAIAQAKEPKAERDENTCRLDFKPSEIAAMSRRIEAEEKPKADERKQATLKQNSTDKPSGEIPPTVAAGRVSDIAARHLVRIGEQSHHVCHQRTTGHLGDTLTTPEPGRAKREAMR